MRSNNLVFIICLISILIIDFILWYQLRPDINKKWKKISYIAHSLFFLFILLLLQIYMPRLQGPEAYFWIGTTIGLITLFYHPKFIFILFNGIGRIFQKQLPVFSKLIAIASKSIAILLFIILLYSITWGRYNYKIETFYIPVPNLPTTFNNFRIIQLSDLHLGSYSKHYQGISRLVKEVNDLHPDLIVFTGDMVNNFASEMTDWIDILKEMKAPYGKLAVMGNHDYGDYSHWSDISAKKQNIQDFFNNMNKIGFQMLNNSNTPIVSNQDTIWIAGVENWGKPPFPRYGDLNRALEQIGKNQTIILLSHDPSHWKSEVIDRPITLALAGHTHAMQFGLQIGNKKWSPAQYIYPEYDGIYQHNDKHLHVSRGQGYLGFPGRVGLRPVITLLILKSKN